MNVHSNAGKKLKILIAEDDPDDQLILGDAFAEMPVDLDFVKDGSELIEYLGGRRAVRTDKENELPDLIIMDLFMLPKDGISALKLIKQDNVFRRIPVVITSISEFPGDIYQAYDLGAAGYMTKPDTLPELKLKIKSMVHYWRDILHVPARADRPGENKNDLTNLFGADQAS